MSSEEKSRTQTRNGDHFAFSFITVFVITVVVVVVTSVVLPAAEALVPHIAPAAAIANITLYSFFIRDLPDSDDLYYLFCLFLFPCPAGKLPLRALFP